MRYSILILAALGASATPAVAHPDGHDQQYRAIEKTVPEKAQDAVVKLVTQAKLPASWSRAEPIKSFVRTRKGAKQWVVTFENKVERRRDKRLLHVLMTPAGEFLSANHKLI